MRTLTLDAEVTMWMKKMDLQVTQAEYDYGIAILRGLKHHPSTESFHLDNCRARLAELMDVVFYGLERRLDFIHDWEKRKAIREHFGLTPFCELR